MARGEGGGRPKSKIDPDQVRKLAGIGCSYEEMGSILQCDPSTLTRRFAQVIKEGRDSGHMSLKRKQYEVAMTGNVSMLIWLGKIRLGQRETIVQETIHKTNDESIDLLAEKLAEVFKLASE